MWMKCTMDCNDVCGKTSLFCSSYCSQWWFHAFLCQQVARILTRLCRHVGYFFPTSLNSSGRWVCTPQPVSHSATAGSNKYPYIMFPLTVNTAVQKHVAQQSQCSSQKPLIDSQCPGVAAMNINTGFALLFHSTVMSLKESCFNGWYKASFQDKEIPVYQIIRFD